MLNPIIFGSVVVVSMWMSSIGIGLASSSFDGEQRRDLSHLVAKSNLIFVGKAESIRYRNAQQTNEEGLVPYTIVTYRIDQVLRGKAPDKTITMKLIGGPDGRGRFLDVTGVPVVQKGDHDILFVRDTQDPVCPLAFCEDGRYRVMDDRVFDTSGSPVLAVKESKVISHGLGPKEFHTVRFPAPQFDDLLKNPEVIEILKSQNMTVEDARRRYQESAPKVITVTEVLSAEETSGDSDSVETRASPAQEAPAGEPMVLSKFVESIRGVEKVSRSKTLVLRSVDPTAEIVAPKARPSAPKQAAPSSPRSESSNPESLDEYQAYERNGFNPVIRK